MLGIGLNLPKLQQRLLQSEGQTYINLATAAGYSGGSATCANASFDALKDIPALGYSEAVAYFDLADAASYTGGSLFCSEKSFEALINIA